MGKPLMIHENDDEKIEELKERTGLKSKVDVVRAGLILLEKQTLKEERIHQWKKAVESLNKQSQENYKDFQKHSRLKRIP